MDMLHLTKLHGLGNDFLVLLDLDDRHPLTAELARALCDRHRGVGADGLIRATAGRDGADLSMQLRNADGGEAEISGNGIGCLGLAVVEAGLVTGSAVTVATAAGLRQLQVNASGSGAALVSVDMGEAKVGPDQPQHFPDRKARTVDMGNPHLVLLGPDPGEFDVATLGPQIEAVHAGGINIEFVSRTGTPDLLNMRVWERGVGETLACGTGACAAAAAAHDWGLVVSRVRVSQPGGVAVVDVLPGTVVLTVPVERIAAVEVHWPR